MLVLKTMTYFIAAVWFVNGLFCKLLNLVPRHQQIVASILGEEYAWHLTKTVGALELMMVIWILSGIQPRLCAAFQMLIVAAMVSIEIILVPDLLLFGRVNAIPALFFISLIYLNEFVWKKALKNKSLQKVS